MTFTRNRKIIAGTSIILTDAAFMLTVYGTHYHVPFPIVAVHLTALLIGFGFIWRGSIEERKLKPHPNV
jgi:hypothetical protein